MNTLEAILQEPPIELRWGGRLLVAFSETREPQKSFTLAELQALHAALEDVIHPRRRQVMQVVRLVAEEFQVDMLRVLKCRQPEPIATARVTAMSLVSGTFGHMTDAAIGEHFNCTHSNIVHARRAVAELEETQPKFAARLVALHAKVQDALFPKPE